MSRKVCVVVTARASYSRVRSVLQAMRARHDVELQLVVAASALLTRYGSVVDVIERDGFHVDAKVPMVLEGESLLTAAKSTGIGLSELASVFDRLQPDAVVTIADRYETMATATAAAYLHIPLVHIQGGEVTGSIDEKVRHAVTKLADMHCVATGMARERVIAMGEDPERVWQTGCPSIDLARDVAERLGNRAELLHRYGGVGPAVDLSRGYLVVLQHPVTNEHADAFMQADETLNAVAIAGLPVFWFWPNVDAGTDGTSKAIRTFRERDQPAWLHLFRNMDPEDFLELLLGARCLVGNSSVGIRECSFLGVPAVNIGTRQHGRERGANVIDVDHEWSEIVIAIEEHQRRGPLAPDHLYGDGAAGPRIAQILATAPLTVEKRLAYV